MDFMLRSSSFFKLQKLHNSAISMGIANLMFLAILFVNGVFGVEAVAVEVLEVMEGEPVVLDTKCITKLQRDDNIVWKFESNVIATIKANKPLIYDTEDAKFKDKLQINDQTGDLTIRNTRTTHSGLYEVNITNITTTTYRRFRVAVLDPIPTKVSVTVGESVILQHNIADIHIYDVIEWRFEDGKTPIAQINKQNSENPSYDKNDERFRDRLKLDQTGSLTITDTRTTDSGLYKLLVTGTNTGIKYRRFRVTVDEPGLSTGVIITLICLLIALVSAAVVVVICWCRRSKGEDKERGVHDPLKGEQ